MSVYFVEYLGVTRTSGRVCQCASVEILESMSLCRACGSRSTVFVCGAVTQVVGCAARDVAGAQGVLCHRDSTRTLFHAARALCAAH